MAPPEDNKTKHLHGPSAQYQTPAAPGPPAYQIQAVNTPAPADPLIGATLMGRYYIEKKLGEGGMGSVYLATHVTLEKKVALKVLHMEFARKQDLIERFLQEAKAASRIRNDHVIDITDFGATEEGYVFFAMELLGGHDLHEELSKAKRTGQRFPWQRTKFVFLQMCEALSAAHARGIIHRDLKPENIYLIDRMGTSDYVKLLDFGIAKMTEVTDGERKLTRTGMLFGTPEYMSPEQARGDKPDVRVDVYAMGCILFQMITGRVPFEAENFMSILTMHLTQEAPLMGPAVAEVGAPAALEAVVQKALMKEREQRFATIDEMAQAIIAVDGGAVLEMPMVGQGSGASKMFPSVPAKTMWTGSVSIPEVGGDEEGRPRKAGGSKAAVLAVVGILAAAGIGVGLYIAMGSSGKAAGGEVAEAPAKPPAETPPTEKPPEKPPEQPAIQPPAEPELPPPPAKVTLAFDSVPPGAEVFDEQGKRLGRTPLDKDVPGSNEARLFTFSMMGYRSKNLDLVPNEDIEEKVTLNKLKSGDAETAAPEVVVAHQKKRPRRPGTPTPPVAEAPTEPVAETPTEPVAETPAKPAEPAVEKPVKPRDRPDKPTEKPTEPTEKPPGGDEPMPLKPMFPRSGG